MAQFIELTVQENPFSKKRTKVLFNVSDIVSISNPGNDGCVIRVRENSSRETFCPIFVEESFESVKKVLPTIKIKK